MDNYKKFFFSIQNTFNRFATMENKKYQYLTLKVTTEQEYKEAEKLVSFGWVAFNVLLNGDVIQFIKEV